ncbi:hypothetical protein ACHAWO_002027 [Cyclotella atomus]|uniref:Tubby C-terminal domain-containing protein n=1 Tax=Cyclotella atomus TaxID=382360 RepID=A0ABD3PPM8_9STRA
MGCTQSMHTNLNTIIDDETDCRDDCTAPHCKSSKKWNANMLCHSPARPPRMPLRSASCGAANVLEEVDPEIVRWWIPVDDKQLQVREDQDVPNKHHLIHSQSSEHDPVEMKQRQMELIERYDLNTLHLPLFEPFLGSMYWTAATPLPKSRAFSRRQTSSPSILACSSSVCTSLVTNTAEINAPPRSPEFGLNSKQTAVGISTDSTEEISRSEDEINLSLNSITVNIGNNVTNYGDVSRELLDYSVLDEDIISEGVPQTPRRLFEEEEMVTPSRFIDNSIFEIDEDDSIHDVTNDEFETIPDITIRLSTQHTSPGCSSQDNISPTISEINLEVARITHNPASSPGPITPPKPLPPSPNIATFYGNWGSRRERHVSTLPSQISGRPIRLRITETRPTDMFSYDPYYNSSGTYVITQEYDRPYGNGLLMRMGTQFMTLEDGRGCTLAVIKSRYTHVPSSVVYAPKPRFVGQAPSGHRLSNLAMNNGAKNASEYSRCSSSSSSELYPWALIRKEGRTMGDACTVHLVDESIARSKANAAGGGGNRRNSGMFVTMPNFRGCHGFEGEWNTHTMVTRSLPSSKSSGIGGKDAPCCVIVRDPMNVEAVDITIAPGIDPLLMICYLAAHSKMDVEPIMGGF